MRSMVLTVVAALALSVVAFGQNEQSALPKCLQDAAPFNVDVREVTVAKVLPFLGASCGIEIRVENVEGTEATRTLPRVQFQQTKPADVFLVMVRHAGLKYTVLDDKTILVTKQ
jgi:hypothetical protein